MEDLNDDCYPAPSSWAVGYPSREPGLDVWPGFVNPPPGYGEVSFYWWQKDPLSKDRLTWQLDQLRDKSISGLQVNYAHSDQGGLLWGLTYPTEPQLFSEDWWELFNWFLQEAKSRGMSASLSDYTLGSPGQGWFIDEILAEYPQISGAKLACTRYSAVSGETFVLDTLPQMLSWLACRFERGEIVEQIDLSSLVREQILRWECPLGEWQVIVVQYDTVALSIDPMNPLSGQQVIEKFFKRFEDRNPGESGSGLNFFFSDELNFGLTGNLWNQRFASAFKLRKGYDLLPEMAALFMDIGPRTTKIRLDYRDVMVQLEEECYFQPVYAWHQSRGMIYGCDHGGRGKDVVEFGDYFRTQKWNQGPGNDQPDLESDIIKNKVSSSIAHLYERPRTWLEGFYGSGWGTSSGQLADAIFRNFVMGHNLLSLHGLYYTTHGGHWEWAPPCNHFRMPYWQHMGELLKCSERLSYLLSQGVHCCDVAILYPVASVEAGLDGEKSVSTAFSLAEFLFRQSVDFDFIDFESVARASTELGQLKVSGESYRVLVLPAMRAVRFSTIEKALAFHRSGGTVIALGSLPEASDRAGSGDGILYETVREIFELDDTNSHGHFLATNEQVLVVVNAIGPRDFSCLAEPEPIDPVYVQHRKIGVRDLYMVYGAPRQSVCFFRAWGTVELWDPWSGSRQELVVSSQTAEGSILQMPLGSNEVQLIVFTPQDSVVSKVSHMNPVFEACATAADTMQVIALPNNWAFELQPTMDNRWGDYQLPASAGMIGALARQLWYVEETTSSQSSFKRSELHSADLQSADFPSAGWNRVTCDYGPHFQKLGPLPAQIDHDELGTYLAIETQKFNPRGSIPIGSKSYEWQPLVYSTRWGIEGDPGHQGYHGLKGEVPDDFIGLGTLSFTATDSTYLPEADGTTYYLWTTVRTKREEKVRVDMGLFQPDKVWLNGQVIDPGEAEIQLQAGVNTLLLFYPTAGKTHFILESLSAPVNWQQGYPLAMKWYGKPVILNYDIHGFDEKPVGWYRFTSPPGLRSMTLNVFGQVQIWVDDRLVDLDSPVTSGMGASIYQICISNPVPEPVQVVLRIEPLSGHYAGAALPEPILFDCQAGSITLGDWSEIDGLHSYSGGAWYRQTVDLNPEQLTGSVTLDLGEVVSSAEIHINGHSAGIRVAPPWQADITPWLVPGQNRIEILVYNTLANHYTTIPTRYRGSTLSGLIGPARLIVQPRKTSYREHNHDEYSYPGL